jgi:hypothetical protein
MKTHRFILALTLLFAATLTFAQASPDATGSGTSNFITRWLTATSQGTSKIYQSPTTGWIGINTTTPKVTFDINSGNFIARGIGNFAGSGNAAYLYAGDTSHGLAAYRGGGLVAHGGTGINAYQATNGIFLQDTTRYVGIGTTNPHSQLQVAGSVQANYLVLTNWSGGDCAIYYSLYGTLTLYGYTTC